MSNLKEHRAPGLFGLVAGVIFPAVVIVIELIGAMCADVFFDPIPSPAHLAIVTAVPVINGLLWRAGRREHRGSAWLIAAGGGAIAISAAYTLLLLPILPFAIVAIIFFGVGLLPFGPL